MLDAMDVVTGILKSISNRLRLPSVIAGIVLAIVGLTLVIMAKRIMRAVRQTNDISDKDKSMLYIKITGLLFMFLGMFIMILAA